MMLRSQIATMSLAVGGGLVGIVACSASEPPATFTEADASAPDVDSPVVADAGADTATDSGLERPPFDPADVPVSCKTNPCVVELVAGDRHFCARMNDDTTRCWGDDSTGALGISSQTRPDAGAPALGNVKQLAAGGATTCALLGDGGVQCWGANDHGQLGLDGATPIVDGDPHPTPMPVSLTTAASRVDVGQNSVCAVLANNGEPWCWGDNSQSQLGQATLSGALAPAKAQIGNVAVTRMAIGSYSVVALTNNGEITSWGALAGAEGVIAGRQASVPRDPLAAPLDIGSVTNIAASTTTTLPAAYPKPARGIAHACAVAKGEVFCWGDSLLGALGVGMPGPRDIPARAFLTNASAWAQQIATAGEITCARFTDGTVECTGDNAFGALGMDPKNEGALTFKPVPTLHESAVRVAVATHTACALVEDGRVLCWGSNEHGELGQGTSDEDPHPEPIQVKFQ